MMRMRAVLSALAGLAGGGGVVLAALAAHTSASPNLATAAHMLLFHATAALAVTAILPTRRRRPILWGVAGALLLGGAALFSGVLALGALAGLTLVPMAAPIGGSIMILGWLMVALVSVSDLIDGDRS